MTMHFCPSLETSHFKNSCLHRPLVYSCAICCFLEVSYRIFASYLNDIRRIELFERLLICESTEIENDRGHVYSSNDILTEVREPVWCKISCPSFQNRDSSAQFSEIFSSQIVKSLTVEEKILFQTSCCLEGTCTICAVSSVANLEVIVSFISLAEYPQLVFDYSAWPIFVID